MSVPKPLSDFVKIGHNTFIYTPEAYAPPKTPLILLLSWNAAAPKHIAKYTVAYQRLFPTARIVLVQCHTPDMFRFAETYRKLLEPALNAVKEHIKTGGEVLLHSFSNGGGNQAVEIMKAWKHREGTILPIRAQILDSAPTKGEWRRSHAAIVASLPPGLFWRLFGGLAVHLFIIGVFIFNTVLRRENKMVVMCRQLNDPAFFDIRAPRVYLYSKADKMVGFEEVEEHIAEGVAKGWDIVKVQFKNSAHTGHVREDESKYWGAVLEAWKRGPKA
ncbi:indole-diterpene biosynthesis protein-like protein PaxU [Dendryphion nanum]|uniref:Indole-diterpene biosynthesis protein-like protein PaxU n=1 Tax=Dendryphion nanum TaxID=256645 RepID=A0A9P9D9G4_9PLEO|nr:indole-diterpene biosynthesis protein-like protein PaxU [Dendryphion nanum]